MKITRQQAEKIVLERLNSDPTASGERFAIAACELSARGGHWIIQANSAAYLESGDFHRMYVGVNAYLIDTNSGAFDYVGSGEQVEDCLQDKYDEQAAGGRHYVLCCSQERSDKHGLIRLHQVLGCSLVAARQRVSPAGRIWLHGRRRLLAIAATLLRERGLAVSIELVEALPDIPELSESLLDEDSLLALLRQRFTTGS